MFKRFTRLVVLGPLFLVACGNEPLSVESPVESVQQAVHAWGNYHWARKVNPFTLKLGDNVSSAWDSYLATTSSDWTASPTLDTTIVPGGTTARRCRATAGKIEVCNESYGNNGWLGLASIWATGDHITQATAKMNDSYFNSASYNTPAWRNMVMCQEVAHGFGLGHQDETHANANLGSCMDYTSDPAGTIAEPDQLSNEHPNAHDFEQLATIYAHFDTTTTIAASLPSSGAASTGTQIDTGEGHEDVGKPVGHDENGRPHTFVKRNGRDSVVITHVFWAN